MGEGLWRCPALERALVLVSRDTLPVEPESMPLHLVSREPTEREQTLVREVLHDPALLKAYGAWLVVLHPHLKDEVIRMMDQLGVEPTLDLRPAIELMGLQRVIDQLGLQR